MAREFADYISRITAQPNGASKLAIIKRLLDEPDLIEPTVASLGLSEKSEGASRLRPPENVSRSWARTSASSSPADDARTVRHPSQGGAA
jgi:hypothetical protein